MGLPAVAATGGKRRGGGGWLAPFLPLPFGRDEEEDGNGEGFDRHGVRRDGGSKDHFAPPLNAIRESKAGAKSSFANISF